MSARTRSAAWPRLSACRPAHGGPRTERPAQRGSDPYGPQRRLQERRAGCPAGGPFVARRTLPLHAEGGLSRSVAPGRMLGRPSKSLWSWGRRSCALQARSDLHGGCTWPDARMPLGLCGHHVLCTQAPARSLMRSPGRVGDCPNPAPSEPRLTQGPVSQPAAMANRDMPNCLRARSRGGLAAGVVRGRRLGMAARIVLE